MSQSDLEQHLEGGPESHLVPGRLINSNPSNWTPVWALASTRALPSNKGRPVSLLPSRGPLPTSHVKADSVAPLTALGLDRRRESGDSDFKSRVRNTRGREEAA
ncbi:hypothetical protein SKAU_G00165960 [Synaphobranchus kaupii]|uniref:Uncharacterized protein n=1 Tax=Synaphobranchus kaupii TaxID=118154 RepID=A0A9Q1FJK2_SYNKA|nr:hypothetical protein SKAU_G00165960 [Synaphobranchus kaupii]